MAILKVQNNDYNLANVYEIMCSYILYQKIYRNGKVCGKQPVSYYGIHNLYGNFVNYETVANISKHMDITAKALGKDFGQCILHFEIAFDTEGEEWQITPEMANEYAYRIVTGFFYNYQSVYAVHTNTDNIHIHFVINAINLVTMCKPDVSSIYTELRDYINMRKDFYFTISKIKRAVRYQSVSQ